MPGARGGNQREKSVWGRKLIISNGIEISIGGER
jgi:hypothetical protein